LGSAFGIPLLVLLKWFCGRSAPGFGSSLVSQLADVRSSLPLLLVFGHVSMGLVLRFGLLVSAFGASVTLLLYWYWWCSWFWI